MKGVKNSNQEYKFIAEDVEPRADLEARPESRINNLTIYDWKVNSIFQSIAAVIIVLMERELARAESTK